MKLLFVSSSSIRSIVVIVVGAIILIVIVWTVTRLTLIGPEVWRAARRHCVLYRLNLLRPIYVLSVNQ